MPKYKIVSKIEYTLTAKNEEEAEEKFWDEVGYISYPLGAKIKEKLKVEEVK